MDLRQLACFVAVAEELNFSRAARRMHITQPPFSRQIQKLEDELGTRLLIRSAQSVTLTPAGSALLDEARHILSLAARAPEIARRAAKGQAGSLRIGFVGSTIYTSVPAQLQAFRRLYPDVEVTLQQLTVARQIRMLLSHEIDLGFIRQAVSHPELQMRSLLKESFVVAVPASHLFAERSEIDLSEIANEDIVSFSRVEAPAIHSHLHKMCEERHFTPRIVQEAYPMSTVVGLVASGVGIAIVPESMCRLSILNVVYVPLSGTDAQSEFLLAWRKGDPSPTLHNFLGMQAA